MLSMYSTPKMVISKMNMYRKKAFLTGALILKNIIWQIGIRCACLKTTGAWSVRS
jgi:hypothetical protein